MLNFCRAFSLDGFALCRCLHAVRLRELKCNAEHLFCRRRNLVGCRFRRSKIHKRNHLCRRGSRCVLFGDYYKRGRLCLLRRDTPRLLRLFPKLVFRLYLERQEFCQVDLGQLSKYLLVHKICVAVSYFLFCGTKLAMYILI